MDEKELQELKNKADAGDPTACVDYAIYLKDVAIDSKAALRYMVLARKNNVFNTDAFVKFAQNAWLIYIDLINNGSIKAASNEAEILMMRWRYEANGGDDVFDGFTSIDEINKSSDASAQLELIKEMMNRVIRLKDDVLLKVEAEIGMLLICKQIIKMKDLFNSKYELRHFVGDAYYYEYLLDDSHPFKSLLAAEKNGSTKNNNCETTIKIIECLMEGKNTRKDLNSALIWAKTLPWDDNPYKEEIMALLAFEQGDYEKVLSDGLDDSSHSINRNLFNVCYQNLGGNHFNIQKAIGYLNKGKFDTEFKNNKKEEAEAQKQNDIGYKGQNKILPIPTLEIALRNEVPYFVEKAKSLLSIDIDSNVLKSLNDVNIVFSYEKKEIVYKPSLDDIVSMINKLIDHLKQLKKEKECNELEDSDEEDDFEYSPFNDYPDFDDDYDDYDDNDESEVVDERISKLIELINLLISGKLDIDGLAKELENIEITGNDRKLRRIYETLLSSTKIHNFVTYGTYSNRDNTITLYLSNIYDLSKELDVRPELCCVNEYVHELFHCLHYAMGVKEDGDSKCNDIVLESLASFFQHEYACDYYAAESIYAHKKDCLGDSSETRIKNKISIGWGIDMYLYPYSGAKYFNLIKENYYSNSLFKKVFIDSLIGTSKAFKSIEQFYELENDL